MRILQVIHDFVPETLAGAEINTHKLAVDLHRRYGYEVHVFCRGWDLSCEPYRERDDILDGLQVRRVDFGAGGLPNRWRRHDDRLDAAFRRTLERVRPDLVHIQHFIYLSTKIVAIAREYGVPVIVSLRNFWFRCAWGTLLDHDDRLCERDPGVGCLSCLWPDRQQRRRELIPWRQLNPILITAHQRLGNRAPLPPPVGPMLESLASWEDEFRAALLRASHLHSPSQFLKHKLIEFGVPDEHVSVVSNGFRYDPAHVRPKQPSRRLRFGMIGMHRLKGLHLLIEAFRELPQQAAELRVYGQIADPRYAAEQQRRAEGYNIRFCGIYAQDALYDVFSAIDVLVVPSIWYENCPTVIREAFATGTPVVASDIGGMAEAVTDGVNGLLFAAGDAADLRRKLAWIIEHREALPAMAQAIPSPLTVEQCTDGIVALYDRVMEAAALCR